MFLGMVDPWLVACPMCHAWRGNRCVAGSGYEWPWGYSGTHRARYVLSAATAHAQILAGVA